MRREEAEAVALWAVASHAFEVFWGVSTSICPRRPEKGSGKSTLLDVLSRLVPRPVSVSNISSAALFRLIERDRPVLLLDEADTFVRDNIDLRNVLNTGHRKDGKIVRCVGNDYEPRTFSAFAPVALAAIRDLPGTIEDRSIKIRLRRRRPDESIEPLRLNRAGELTKLARMAARWAIDHEAQVREADPVIPDAIVNREADNWFSLFAVADAAGENWSDRARGDALALSREGRDAADADAPGIILLGDLREMFAAESSGVLFTPKILQSLNGREDRAWAEFHRGKPLDGRQMAKLLRPYDITTNQTVRRGIHTGKGYKAGDFADAWSRYLPSLGAVTKSQTPILLEPAEVGSVTGEVT